MPQELGRLQLAVLPTVVNVVVMLKHATVQPKGNSALIRLYDQWEKAHWNLLEIYRVCDIDGRFVVVVKIDSDGHFVNDRVEFKQGIGLRWDSIALWLDKFLVGLRNGVKGLF
jgi:hypothetical protein